MNTVRIWVRDVLVIVTCIVMLVMGWKAWQGYQAVRAGLTSISREFTGTDFPTPDWPAPTATGCPYGPGQCGG